MKEMLFQTETEARESTVELSERKHERRAWRAERKTVGAAVIFSWFLRNFAKNPRSSTV
jgi:hypothetical protein